MHRSKKALPTENNLTKSNLLANYLNALKASSLETRFVHGRSQINDLTNEANNQLEESESDEEE